MELNVCNASFDRKERVFREFCTFKNELRELCLGQTEQVGEDFLRAELPESTDWIRAFFFDLVLDRKVPIRDFGDDLE